VTTTTTAGRTCSRLASEGTKGNRLAIAVRVKVCAKGMTQIRWPSGKLDTLMGCQPASSIPRWKVLAPCLENVSAPLLYSCRPKSKSATSPAIVIQTAPRAVRGGQPPLQ